MKGSWYRAALLVSALSCAAGCSAPKPSYWKHPHRSVAVLPPFSVKQQAWEATWGPCEQELAERGFRVLPRRKVQAFMRENGFTFPEELKQFTTAELLEAFGTDLILTTQVDEWDEVVTIALNYFCVKVSVELRDGEHSYLASSGDARLTGSLLLSKTSHVLTADVLAAPAVHSALESLPSVPPAGYAPAPPGAAAIAAEDSREEAPPGVVLQDDSFEPNDNRKSATRVQRSRRYKSLRAVNNDWYAVDLQAGELLDVTIRFDKQVDDLDLSLHDARKRVLASSATFEDTEHVRYRATEAGSVYIRVKPSHRAGVEYVLEVR